MNRSNNMKFMNPEARVTTQELAAIESDLLMSLPTELKHQYSMSNGGSPSPYVYEDENLDTVVSEFLPIISFNKKRTAIDSYKHLVLAKKIVPLNYFPFAIDGGGDYFFVDCLSANGWVYFYRGDVTVGEENLLPLGVGIGEFWSKLRSA